MSILDLHADVTSAALPRYVKPPQLTPEAPFSVWKLTTSPLRGIGEAVSQVGASVAEVVAGYGDVMGRIESGQSLQNRQPDMQSDFGDALRDRGRQFRPDPLTAHAAEQVLYGFARGASKVIGGTLVAGPGGAIAAGVEEGISAADDLAREGVDFPTRVKAGAVQGAGLALAALPLVGKTLPQTAALYLAGGPGGFMAQQALTREILRAGGYEGIAAAYDPLDPVGLTVSALIPAAFTAAGIRAQRAPRRVPVDVEDAARVALQAEQRRSTNPETGPRAADQHETALTRAEDSMARGDEVRVADVAPRAVITGAEREANFRAWFGDSKVVDAQGAPRVVFHGTNKAFDRFDADAIGSGMDAGKLGRGFYFSEDPNLASGYAKPYSRGGDGAGANVMPVFLAMRNPLEFKAETTPLWDKLRAQSKAWGIKSDPVLDERNMDPNPEWAREFTDAARAAGHDGVVLDFGDGRRELMVFEASQVKSAIGNSGKFDPSSASLTDSLADFGARIENAATAMRKAAGPDAPPIVARLIGEPAPLRAAPDAVQPADVTAPPVAPESQAVAATEAAATPGAAAETGAAAGRLAQIQAQFPDLMVRMDGDDQARPLAEFLAAVKAEADEMTADAPLMQVAAECALLNGA